MALRGQVRTPGQSARVRRNFDNKQPEWIDQSSVIRLVGGLLTLILKSDGGLTQTGGELAIKLDATPGLALSADGLTVLLDDTEPGLQLSSGLKILLATNPGLEFSTGLRAKINDAEGMARDADGLAVKLSGDGSLEFAASGVGSGGVQAKLAPGGGLGTSAEGLLVVGGIPITTEVPSGTIDGSNAEFTLSDVPGEGEVLLFVNGLLMSEADDGSGDYDRDGTAITFESGAIPETGDVLLAAFLSGPDAAGETPAGAVNGVNATFTLANTPETSSLMLFANGMLLTQGAGSDYTLADDTITFEAGAVPEAGDTLFAVYQKDSG